MRSGILAVAVSMMLGAGLPAAATDTGAPPAAPESAAAEAVAPEVGESEEAAAEPVVSEMPVEPIDVVTDADAVEDAEVAVAEAIEIEVPVEETPPAGPMTATAGTMQLGPEGLDAEGRRGRIHTVADRHTLWDISEAYLGTPWVWPSIWQDNRDIDNPHLIHPGDRIWITSTEMRLVSETEARELIEAEQAHTEVVAEPADVPAAPELAASEPIESETLVEVEPVPEAAPAPDAPAEVVRVSWIDNMGFVSRDALDAASSIVESPSPRIWLSQSDVVYLGLGEGEVQVGDQFSVFRDAQPVHNFGSSRVIGYHVDILGWIEVEEVQRETAIARVRRSVSEMHRGDRLVPRRNPTHEVELKSGPAEFSARVIFMPSHRTVAGTIDYVYLNRGEMHGLEVGTRLEVYESGDIERDEPRRRRVMTPDHVVADLVVVSVEPETAVALVTHTSRELELGDHIRTMGHRRLASRP